VYDGLEVRASSVLRHQRAEGTPDQAETLPESGMWKTMQRVSLEGWQDRVEPVQLPDSKQEHFSQLWYSRLTTP
jgi:hypothetical protein